MDASMSVRLKRNMMIAKLDFLFVEKFASVPYVTPSFICQEYMSCSDTSLLDDLRETDSDLVTIVRNNYSHIYKVLSDGTDVGFLRIECINSNIAASPLFGHITGSQTMKAIEHTLSQDEGINTFTRSASGETDNVSMRKTIVNEKASESKAIKDDFGTIISQPVVTKGIPLPPPGFEPAEPVFPQSSRLINCAPPGFENSVVLKQNSGKSKEAIPLFDIICSPVITDDRAPEQETIDYEKEKSDNLDDLGLSNFRLNKNKNSAHKEDHFYESDFEDSDLVKPASQVAGIPNNLEPLVAAVQSDLESNSASNFKMIPYILVNNRVVNYQEALELRKNLTQKIAAQMYSSLVLVEWSKTIVNLAGVINHLKNLHKLYPHGCTANELTRFEEELKAKNNHFAQMSSLPSIICLLDNQMLYADIKGKFFVNDEIVKVKLQYLKKNFCSNFYRLLNAKGGSAKVLDLADSLQFLVPKNVSLSTQHILRLCSRYPLLYSLQCSKNDNFNFENSTVILNSIVANWQVVFDCDSNDVDGTMCDCESCTSNA